MNGNGAADPRWWGGHGEMFGPRNAHRLSMMLAHVDALAPRSLILEAAAGLGDFSEHLRRRGHRVIGVDASIDALLAARQRTSAMLVVADINALPFRDTTFDAVTSGETLEHLPDDRGAVRELARVLRDGGRSIISVPALEALRTFSDNYYQHLRRYSRKQLEALFRDAGFDVVNAHYWGFPLVLIYDYLFMLPMNLRRARRPIADDAALRGVAKMGKVGWLVSTARALFGTDRFFRWVPIGVGLILTAEKHDV